MRTQPRWNLVLLLLGAVLLAFFRLGHLPLMDVDEPVYGEVGREMAHAPFAAWLTPHYNGHIWFDKPPLFYWLTGLSMTLFGPTEFAARAPSALLSVVLTAVIYVMARRAYPDVRGVGIVAGVIQATCLQQLMLERASVTDMTLVCTLTIALLGVFLWLSEKQARWILLTGAMTGLAILAKGPVALVLIGLQILVFLGVTRQWQRLKDISLWLGLLLCFLVAAPWYLMMIHLHGSVFINEFLEAQNIGRFLHAEHQSTQAIWFFVPVLFAFFFPWSLALPGALVAAVRDIHSVGLTKPNAPTLFLMLWFVIVFGFFSFSSSKLITYIFPMYPAAAILTGVWMARFIDRKQITWALALYSLVAIILTIGCAVMGPKYHVALSTVIALCLCLAVSAVLTLTWRDAPQRWIFPALGTGGFILALLVSPSWRTYSGDVSDRVTAQEAARLIPRDGAFYALGLKHPSLVFYSQRRVKFVDDRDVAVANLRTEPGSVYVMRRKLLEELIKNHGLRDYQVLDTDARTVLIQSTASTASGQRIQGEASNRQP